MSIPILEMEISSYLKEQTECNVIIRKLKYAFVRVENGQ